MPGKATLGLFLLVACLTPAEAEDASSIEIANVNLTLGLRRDKVLKKLSHFYMRKAGEADYWLVSTAPDSPRWIGAVEFKGNKLTLALKNFGDASDQVMHAEIARMLHEAGGTCGFAIAQQPRPNSPLKVTILNCGKKKIAMQVTTDDKAGLYPCNIESLGDLGGELMSVQFWRSCSTPSQHNGKRTSSTPEEKDF